MTWNREQARAAYATRADVREKAIARARKTRLRLDAATKRKYRKAQRRRYLAAGLTIRGTPRQRHFIGPLTFEQLQERLASANALQAWRWWFRHRASDACAAAYYSSKPWNNPRLTAAEAYRLRYSTDAAFRRREYKRLLAKKRRHRAEIAANTVDLTPRDVIQIRTTAAHCFYCGCSLELAVRTIDHVIPLSKGEHSRRNVVSACLSCNSRKQDRIIATASARP